MRKFLTLLVLFTLLACQSESQDPLKSLELKTPAGDVINTSLVFTPKDMEQGLSGVKAENFSEEQGMLFFYLADQEMHFWMPDTYFDLDLFFLDKDLKVLDVIRKLPHYIGRANPDLIPRARGAWGRYVLELKSSSPIAAKIKVGDQLEWKSSLSLPKTEEAIKKQLQGTN
ncbi:MAG: DUF192 domain-containing protein [Bdellovibrionales bacterium]|nr:DUF192 domain-containing protein [Bdellovibrionales bacterium]